MIYFILCQLSIFTPIKRCVQETSTEDNDKVNGCHRYGYPSLLDSYDYKFHSTATILSTSMLV